MSKILDTVEVTVKHFRAEAEMNAALHMASTVRPAPLAAAIETSRDDLITLISELDSETPS